MEEYPLEVRHKSPVYNAVQYKKGMEDGFLELLNWKTGEFDRRPYVMKGGHEFLVQDGFWLIYEGEELRWIRSEEDFRKEFEGVE
jgi:hypothetical protein